MSSPTAPHRTRVAAIVVAAVCLATAAVAVPVKAAVIPAAVVPDDFRPYSDVPEGYVHSTAINGLSVNHNFDIPHLFEGTLCGDGLFCPEEPLLRSTFAVWAARVLLYLDGNPMGDETSVKRQGEDPLPPVQTSQFSDVPASAWWAPHAHLLLDRGATRGCGTGADGMLRFCGDRTVTRGQMASFLARIFDLPQADDAGFADVSASHAHGANIDRLASWGITRGCDTQPLRFCADQPVTRGQMASFISRAVGGVGDPPEGYDKFVDVSATDLAVCGVRLSGKLECWDHQPGFWGKDRPTDPLAYPSTDITDVPPGEFRDVELARQHACAIRADNKLVCWGYTQNRMGNFPEGETFRQFSLNDSTGCGVRLRSQTIACWGIDSWNEPLGFYDVPRPNHWPQFVQVSAGGNIICALRQSREVLCWGQDSWTDETGTYLLTRVPPGSYVYVAAGGTQACAVNTAGEIVCWGSVEPGDWLDDLLDNSTKEMWVATPAAPPPGPFIRIYWSDFGHSASLCGLKRDGTGLCWGNISIDVTRQPPPGSRQYKPMFDRYFNTGLDPGRTSACGIRPRGHIDCWGWDDEGEHPSRWTIL